MRVVGLTLLLVLPAAIADAETVTVRLKGGDVVTGELVSRSDRETVIEHAVLGRLVVPEASIAPRDGQQPGLFNTSFLAGWQKELGLGITGQEGNSPETNILLTAALRRETEDWRYRFEGEYKIATESSERTSNYGNFEARRDWLFRDSRWFVAGDGLYQYDEFEPWEQRIHVTVGPGYQLVRRDEFSLDLLAGPSYTYEFGDRNENRPEIMFGAEAVWEPQDGHRLSLRHYFFQQLDEAEWRMRTRADWRMGILGSEHLGVVFGLTNEYDTAAEDERNNLKYWSRLSYDF